MACDPTLPRMNTRQFGKTNVSVSEIGLGCWQLGGADWGNLDDQHAFEILDAAADAGITFFDTADVYGSGRSESLKRWPRLNPAVRTTATYYDGSILNPERLALEVLLDEADKRHETGQTD